MSGARGLHRTVPPRDVPVRFWQLAGSGRHHRRSPRLSALPACGLVANIRSHRRGIWSLRRPVRPRLHLQRRELRVLPSIMATGSTGLSGPPGRAALMPLWPVLLRHRRFLRSRGRRHMSRSPNSVTPRPSDRHCSPSGNNAAGRSDSWPPLPPAPVQISSNKDLFRESNTPGPRGSALAFAGTSPADPIPPRPR